MKYYIFEIRKKKCNNIQGVTTKCGPLSVKIFAIYRPLPAKHVDIFVETLKSCPFFGCSPFLPYRWSNTSWGSSKS